MENRIVPREIAGGEDVICFVDSKILKFGTI